MTSYTRDNSRLANDYDRMSDFQFESGKKIFERLGLAAGGRVLDLGCGTGRLAGWIAERLGADNVVGIDPLPDRIAMAREHVPGVRFEVGRAEDLSAFADASFDGVLLSAVFHWIPDKPKALAEIARVLRHGGRMGLTTHPKDLQMASTMARTLASIFSRPQYQHRVQRDSFAIARQSCTVSETLAMLLENNLDLVELHLAERIVRHKSAGELLDFMESSAFGNFLDAIPPELQGAFRADFEAALPGERGSEGIELRDYGMLLVARRSGASA